MGACKHQPALTNNRATMLNNRLTNNRATELTNNRLTNNRATDNRATNNRATNNRLTNNRATQLEQSMNRQIFLVTLVLKLVKTEIQLE